MNARFPPYVFAAALCAASPLTLVAVDLTTAQVKASAENWPTQIKVSELLDFGVVKSPAGAIVDFQDLREQTGLDSAANGLRKPADMLAAPSKTAALDAR